MKGYPSKIYLNGEIVTLEEAKVSVFDRGFLFGDGIYEVMVQINGAFFYKEAHMARLQRCLDAIGISFNAQSLKGEIDRLLKSTQLINRDCLLYIQVTRGVAPRQHAYPKNTRPTVMMYAIPKDLPEINGVHAHVITAQDFRWSRCDIKMTSLLGNVMLNEYAMEHDCYETVLVRDGVVTEASHCNVFFVKDSMVYTHPANEFILDGITRQIVLELCGKLNIQVVQEPVLIDEVCVMKEAFLVGTSTQIASIQKLNDHVYYKDNEIGPITKRLQRAFLELKKSNIKNTIIN
jgi:D-alanine transaminase